MSYKSALSVYEYAKQCLNGRNGAIYKENRKVIAAIGNKHAVKFGWPLLSV